MNPLDDRIPEEMEPQNEELFAFLRRSYHSSAALTPDEEEQSLANVRERLLDVLPSPKPVRRRHPRFVRALNAIAAVLVVGLFIGAALFLFARHPQSTTVSGPPLGPVGAPSTIKTEANGLSATMKITSGPYFLSELLTADVSITNHTTKTFTIQGVPASSPCDSALNVILSGGTVPHYAVPVYGFMSCPMSFTQFKPGQTIRILQYVPLTASGAIALTLDARFLTTTIQNGEQNSTNGPSPLDGHWPTLHIVVRTQIPSNRTISLQLDGSQVIIQAPASIRPHLLYNYTVACTGTSSGDFWWDPIKTTTINEPGCPGPNVQWQYAVSAPGYAIASGKYPPSSR